MALSRPFKGRSSSASSFHASLLQAIDGVMSLALRPQVVSQAHVDHGKSVDTVFVATRAGRVYIYDTARQ